MAKKGIQTIGLTNNEHHSNHLFILIEMMEFYRIKNENESYFSWFMSRKKNSVERKLRQTKDQNGKSRLKFWKMEKMGIDRRL